MTAHMLTFAATDWSEVAAIAQLATAGVAALALLGAVLQLAQNRRHVRATRAHQYLERYGSPDEIPLVAKLNDFIRAEPSEQAARLEEWTDMSTQERLEIFHGLNFWEELAGMYQRRLVDRRIVRDYFGSPALAYWGWSEWFIEHSRDKQKSNELMRQFESMCDQIYGGERAKAQRLTFPHLRRARYAGQARSMRRP